MTLSEELHEVVRIRENNAYHRGWWHGFLCAVTAALLGNLLMLPLMLR